MKSHTIWYLQSIFLSCVMLLGTDIDFNDMPDVDVLLSEM